MSTESDVQPAIIFQQLLALKIGMRSPGAFVNLLFINNLVAPLSYLIAINLKLIINMCTLALNDYTHNRRNKGIVWSRSQPVCVEYNCIRYESCQCINVIPVDPLIELQPNYYQECSCTH